MMTTIDKPTLKAGKNRKRSPRIRKIRQGCVELASRCSRLVHSFKSKTRAMVVSLVYRSNTTRPNKEKKNKGKLQKKIKYCENCGEDFPGFEED